MPGICIQCALERFARGEPALSLPYTESEAEHIARYHADLTPEKRSELLRKATERMSNESAEVSTRLSHVVQENVPEGWAFVVVVQHPNHGRSLCTNLASTDDAREVLEELLKAMRAGQGKSYLAPPE